MRHRMMTAATAALLAMTVPAAAQEANQAATDAPGLAEAERTPMEGATEVMDPTVAALPYHDFDGMDVVSAGGETIGEIEGIYQRGDAYFARMNIGGDWFDLIKEEVMVPMDAFRMQGDDLALPITEAEAEALEEWSEGDYDQMAEDLDYDTVGNIYD